MYGYNETIGRKIIEKLMRGDWSKRGNWGLLEAWVLLEGGKIEQFY